MTKLLDLWSKEPERIIGLVTAALALLVAFGFQISTDQQVAVLGIVSAGLILLGGEVTRSQVYSPNTMQNIVSEAVANVETPDTISLGDAPDETIEY